MAMPGFYRRLLPSPPAIDFSSSDGKQMFAEAIQNGTMEGFFKLISNFQTQSEPAYCGLASLSMVLNALAIDPGRKWKGPWRWFDESMLDCCEPLEKVKCEGIPFGKVVCLARCAGAKVVAFRASQSTIDDFRKYLMACSSSDSCHLISSYHRGAFQQTGTGHFSPIGGYHSGKDMVLILDVARFKYPPHWVPLSLLWEAMDTVDETTGMHRGFMMISKLHRAPALLYTLSCNHESWPSTAKFLIEEVPLLIGSDRVKNVKDVLSTIFSSLPSNFSEFIKRVAEVRRQDDGDQSVSEEEKGRLVVKEEVLKQVQKTDLYKHITNILCSEKPIDKNESIFSHVTILMGIAASVCSRGVGLFTGKNSSSLNGFCYHNSCVRCYRSIGDRPVKVAPWVVANGFGEQGSSLNPSNCNSSMDSYSGLHSDILTVLLLALPPQTWSQINDNKVSEDICSLVSVETLPLMLQEEILHLRDQLLLLKRCKDNMVEKDIGVPHL